MLMVEGALLVVVLSALVYGAALLWWRSMDGPGAVVGPCQWRVAHYDASGSTRVVLQRTRPGGVRVVDEHVVATIPVDDPDYDARFLAAMSAARQRRAVFESEAD